MFKSDKSKEFYERLYKFALDCARACQGLPKTNFNQVYSRQLIKASSSVLANYIEAQESLSKKDFLYRLAVCRKESKESKHWLKLIIDSNGDKVDSKEFRRLLEEAGEFIKIFSKSLNTLKSGK